MNRRTFLALCALGASPSFLSACGTSATQHAALPTSTPTPRLTPTPTQPPPLTDQAWSTFASSLQGSLVRRGSAQYPASYRLYNTRFDSIQPAAIAYCASPADVQSGLSFASKFTLPLAPRAGGHSYAGYSTTTGLVLDVTRMNSITINANNATATIGAGARLIDVYSALAQQNLALPAGSCATVGIAGLTLGGGVGVLGRKFGLTSDNLLSAQIVLADNRILTCDANQNADLFWALRGGGGGNFGVVTSFTFRVHPVTAISVFTLRWSWPNASAIFAAWQNWAPQAPDELWSNCWLQSNDNKSASPAIVVNGVFVGSVNALNTQLQQLIDLVKVAPTSSYVSASDLLNTMLLEAGCYGKTVSQCHLPGQTPDGQLLRDSTNYRSDYFAQPLSNQAIALLVNAISQRQSSSILGAGGVGFDAYGGAINRIPANATAFVHRNALFCAQYAASRNANDSASVVSANLQWLNDLWQAMRPYTNGEAYQNYIDPDLPDWQHAYYGSNLSRLQQIKKIYDPYNFFHFKQSLSGT
jgi:FAD/FMN-containing dehydrogenase